MSVYVGTTGSGLAASGLELSGIRIQRWLCVLSGLSV